MHCIVKGRRRHVPYAGWFEDEGWTSIPRVEIVELADLLKIPPGAPCPVTAALKDKSMIQIINDPNLMRLYLGSLVRGRGLEWGAGSSPFPIPLGATVDYADAFVYGSPELRSFPGASDYANFVRVDMVDKIETMQRCADGSIDFALASHVIEHTPNPIAALVSVHRSLSPGGYLILIVPDKDRTFDKPRKTTLISHMVADYEDYQRERDLAHYEEWYTLVVEAPAGTGRRDWDIGADLHYHCFTPVSFVELFAANLGYVTWSSVEFFFPSGDKSNASIEFYVVLRK